MASTSVVTFDSFATGTSLQPPTSPPAGLTTVEIPIVTPVVPAPTLVDGRPQ